MVVCRYFQMGTCNFGERCRFEHPRQQGFGQQSYGGGGGGKFQNTFAGGSNNRFAALSGGDGTSRNQPQQAIKDMQPPEIMIIPRENNSYPSSIPSEIICQEMRVWETSHMWPFSCFTYAKDSRCITGFEDLSPEELRSEAYETQKSNTFPTYQMKVSTLSDEYRMKRQALRNPSAEMKQKLLQEIQAHKAGTDKGSSQSSAFGQASITSTSNVFGNAAPAQGLFGKPSAQPPVGLFNPAKTSQNQFQQVPATQNPFTQVQTGQSAFGAAAPAFGRGQGSVQSTSGVFGASPTAPGSIFGAQPASQQGVFSNASTTAPAAPAPFGQQPQQQQQQQQQQQPPQGLFGKPTVQQPQPGLFGKATAQPAAGLFGKPTDQAVISPFGNTTVPLQQQPGTQPTPPTTLFGKPATTAQPTGLFGKPAPAPGPAPVTAPTAFGGSASSSFGNSSAPQQSHSDSVYTPLTQLTDEEKTQFTASRFVLGKIPMRPPPREMV